MIKKLLIEPNYKEKLDKLSLCQQKQYNDILQNIENEKENYVVSVDIGDNHFKDYDVVLKLLYKNGKFHICECEHIK